MRIISNSFERDYNKSNNSNFHLLLMKLKQKKVLMAFFWRTIFLEIINDKYIGA